MYEPDSPAAADRVRKTFDEQLEVQVDEGVDFIIGETFSWLGEALIAVERGKKTGLPVMVTICFENKDETADGKSAAECSEGLARRGRRYRRHELPAAARAHVARWNKCERRSPVIWLASPWDIARRRQAGFHQPACISRLRSIHYNSPGKRWQIMLCRLATSGSTTSAPAAVRSQSMCAKWLAP